MPLTNYFSSNLPTPTVPTARLTTTACFAMTTAPTSRTRSGARPVGGVFGLQFTSGSVPDHFYATSTRPGNELYATDFSADPKWTTDEPGHFSWDASLQEMHAHIENTPSPYQPNRYFIKELNIDPAQSFSISADLLMDSVKDAGVMLFGLYADDLAH